MGDFRNIVTLTIIAGLSLAVITNADSAVKIVNSVSDSWNELIRTVSGRA